MYCIDPYEYLRWEYANCKKRKPKNLSLDTYFERVKDIYGDQQKELFESDKVLFKKLEELSSQLDLPIEEQDEKSYWLLNRHSSNVNEILKENNIVIPNKVILGTLPTNDFNAFVSPFSNGEILVVLNEGLMEFVYLMGRVISSFFSKKDNENKKNNITFDLNPENVIINLRSNKLGNSKFIEALVLFLAYRDLSLSKMYFEKDENMDLSGILWDNAELFVVAHEYSHIILDHLSPNKVFSKRLLYDDSMLYEIIRSWNEEFSADELALKIVLAHNQKERTGLFTGYLGIEFLFVCFDIIEKACNIEFSDTHPSSNKRINNLRKNLKEIAPEEYDTIINGSKIIEEIGLYLWDVNKEIIYDLCNKLQNNITGL